MILANRNFPPVPCTMCVVTLANGTKPYRCPRCGECFACTHERTAKMEWACGGRTFRAYLGSEGWRVVYTDEAPRVTRATPQGGRERFWCPSCTAMVKTSTAGACMVCHGPVKHVAPLKRQWF